VSEGQETGQFPLPIYGKNRRIDAIAAAALSAAAAIPAFRHFTILFPTPAENFRNQIKRKVISIWNLNGSLAEFQAAFCEFSGEVFHCSMSSISLHLY
jgi:hypothetical protein